LFSMTSVPSITFSIAGGGRALVTSPMQMVYAFSSEMEGWVGKIGEEW